MYRARTRKEGCTRPHVLWVQCMHGLPEHPRVHCNIRPLCLFISASQQSLTAQLWLTWSWALLPDLEARGRAETCALWPPGWYFCQPVPHPEVPQAGPAPTCPESSRWHTSCNKDIRNQDISQMHSFSSVPWTRQCVSGQQAGPECLQAGWEGRTSDPRAVLRAAWRSGLCSAGAGGSWLETERELLRGWEKGFRQRLPGDPESLPNSWAASWVRDDVLSPHEQKRKNVASYFTSLIFHKYQLL